MMKYSLCAPNDGDTMTVSAGGGGWDSPVNDRGNGGGNGGSGSSSTNTDYSKHPEKQAIVNPALAIAVAMPVYPIAGTWGFTLNISPLDVGLAKITSLLAEVAPIAGRVMGFTAGAMFPSSIAPDSLDPTYSKIQQNLLDQIATKEGVFDQGYNVTAMPAGVVSSEPVSEIGKAPMAPASVLAETVVDVEQGITQLALTKPRVTENIPVVKAVETKVPGVYSADVIPGKPALQIKVDTSKPALAKNPPKVNEKATPSSFVETSARDNHHAFIDFGGKHEPVYVSVSKKLTKAQEKQQAEEAKKREQEWLTKHPEAVAERELATRVTELDEAKTNRDKINAQITALNDTVADANRQIEGFKLVQAATPISHAMPEEEELAIYAAYEGYIKKLSGQIAQAKSELVKAEDAITHAEQRRKDAENKAKDEKEKKRKGVVEQGHKYHPAPKTEEISGLGELKKGNPKTPKQGGGGIRPRWIGDKGRKIYEWDSQHGELEGYRASDGQHLGAFDPKTGNQLKPADPTRSIKKYL